MHNQKSNAESEVIALVAKALPENSVVVDAFAGWGGNSIAVNYCEFDVFSWLRKLAK